MVKLGKALPPLLSHLWEADFSEALREEAPLVEGGLTPLLRDLPELFQA